MSKKPAQAIERYLCRHGHDVPEQESLPEPHPALRASIVIPAYDERATIGRVLASLELASQTPEVFEVIVVVNNPADAAADIVQANRKTLAFLDALDTSFSLHLIDRATAGKSYDPDIAGVGLARRQGADLAVFRLAAVGHGTVGLVACLDGDSPVAPGYIDQILAEFDAHPQMLAGVCRYRHPMPDDPAHGRAIAVYEAWMRYWEAAMALTGSPYAFQSIGSCMVLRARGYALADGMPTLEALSDFYMLEKIVKTAGHRHNPVRQLEDPMVYPSARPSGRVPRGTGPSVRLQIAGDTGRFEMAEPPAVFVALGQLFGAVQHGYAHPDALRQAVDCPLLATYLDDIDAWQIFDKFRDNAPTADHFERHFHTWFDNLKIVKFANIAKRAQGGVWLPDAIADVADRLDLDIVVPDVGAAQPNLADWHDLLDALRSIELQVAHRCQHHR